MDKERWNLVRELFSHLSEKSPSFRSNYLDMVCEDDPDLRTQVENMLEGHDQVANHPAFSQNQPEEKLPEFIGQYRIISELGRGGMSVVYSAQHPVYGSVALKVLPQYFVSHPMASARFNQEAAMLRKLSHPVVCRVFATSVEQEYAVIAMEEVSGRTLEHYLQQRPFEFHNAIQIALEIAGALQEAHAMGIYHRDIKPTNILLANDMCPRLIDFGIAKFADTRLTATGEVMGSPAYMSPEQWRAESIGAGTDVWSLGIVLFEMLTGNTPFQADSPAATAQRVFNESAAHLPDKSIDGFSLRETQQLLILMLEKNQTQRVLSMQEICTALNRVMVG